jgi:CheY-like chemotaxis protein
VARAFAPDIIFTDVLLQKKNGYEVCAELKRDPNLKSIPTVLMWSSFMDLDEKAAAAARADSHLEKPFEVESLRKLILDLVPKTRSQRLAHFLNFSSGPTGVTAPLVEEEKRKQSAPHLTPAASPPNSEPMIDLTMPIRTVTEDKTEDAVQVDEAESNWNMDSFEDIDALTAPAFQEDQTDAKSTTSDRAAHDDDEETFAEVRFARPDFPATPIAAAEEKSPAATPGRIDDDELWSHQDLGSFKVDINEPAAMPSPIPGNNIEELEIETFDDKFSHQPIMESFTSTEPSLANDALRLEETADDESTSAIHSDEIAMAGDESFSLDLINGDEDLEMPLRPMTPSQSTGGIPQLSTDRLEEIVRAQSREVIESLVRRIVPELATDIIHKELERLLEDSAVHFDRGSR